MDCGKLTESVYERSVRKAVEANSIENSKFYDGAGLGADCAVLAGHKGLGVLSGQAFASGMDAGVAARAYIAAVGHMLACCANAAAHGLTDVYANLTLLVPERLREAKVRGMVEAAAIRAEETGIAILGCNVQVVSGVTEAAAVCAVNAGFGNAADNDITAPKKRALANEDIVMTKWIGLEGTSLIAGRCYQELCGRYPADLVEEARGFHRYLSVAPEAACAIKSGASYLLMPREGGIFGGLWQLAAENGVGLAADLKSIPVRQETIELCEYFDINPYELMAGGSLLITTSNGGGLVRALEEAGIPAAVIGQTTAGNDRIVRHGEESRFLEPPRGDALFCPRVYKRETGENKEKAKALAQEVKNEGKDFVDYREKQQD